MDLIGALSRNGPAARLAALNKLRKKLLSEAAKAPRQSAVTPRRTGEIPRAIAKVLAEATEPMHLSDICHAVARRLAWPVDPGSVRKSLSEGTRLRNPRFERTALGYYRLASASRPVDE